MVKESSSVDLLVHARTQDLLTNLDRCPRNADTQQQTVCSSLLCWALCGLPVFPTFVLQNFIDNTINNINTINRNWFKFYYTLT